MNKFIKIILLISIITIFITACGKQIKPNNSSVDNPKQPAATTALDTNQTASKVISSEENKTSNTNAKDLKQLAPATTVNTNQTNPTPKNTPSGTSGTNDTTENATFTVTKMYCSSCSFVVKSSIEHVAGVNNVIVNLDGNDNTKGIIKVTFDKTKTDINKIKQSVLDLGYDVE